MNNQKVGDVKIIKPSIDSSQETMNELLFQVVDAINELKDYTLVQPKEQWSCGKCDREAKGINDSEIPNHFRTCPKASVQPEKTLEEKFLEWRETDGFLLPLDELLKDLAQIAAEHYKDKR
jgi:hypothetical protein